MSVTPEMFKKFLSVLPMATVNVLVTKKVKLISYWKPYDEEEGHVLLVKRLNEPAKGYWYTPGGIIRKGETVEEAAVRVCGEETGLNVKLDQLLGVYDECWEKGYFTENFQIVTVGYLAHPLSGELKPDWQSGEVRWFPINQLPQKTGKTVKKMIKQLLSEGV